MQEAAERNARPEESLFRPRVIASLTRLVARMLDRAAPLRAVPPFAEQPPAGANHRDPPRPARLALQHAIAARNEERQHAANLPT